MIIDIRTIPAGHSLLSQKTGLETHTADLPPLVKECLCQAEIDRNGQVLYVHLIFEGVFELECSRCLKPFQWTSHGDLRLVVREAHGTRAGKDESDFFYDCRHLSVNLEPAIYEEIMTSLPLKPLCAPECNGIEITSQTPASSAIDPRWEALKKLKK
jgi:uncharacterized protein